MLNPRLASRYAKSLIDMAVEQNVLEDTLKDVQLIDATLRANRELTVVLNSPVIKSDKKDAIIEAVFTTHLTKLTRAFIKLLTLKGREANLGEMATAFMEQYRTLKNISQVRLVTAASVSTEFLESIRAKVAAALPGQQIEMTTEVKPELIGGFQLEMGDKLVDASIRRDLNDIKKQFLENLYVPKI